MRGRTRQPTAIGLLWSHRSETAEALDRAACPEDMKFCGNGPDLWLRMQQAYDLWHAKRTLRAEIARISTAKAKAA